MDAPVESFFIPSDYSIRQAMERLEQTEEKIVFVVDAEQHLIGSLTDGDIRRWILSDGNLHAQVARICNRNPYIVHEDFLMEAVREQMLRDNLGCIPVVDRSRTIVRLLFWKELFQGQLVSDGYSRLDLPVIIMAGGLGTRLAPFTNVLPKPLIPVGDRTVIEIIISQFLPYGIERFYLTVNYKAKLLKSFFEELAPSYSVQYLEESEPRGTAGSLGALSHCADENLLVTNCDIVIQANIADVVRFHRENRYDLTLIASLREYRIPYGVCELENTGDLACIKEKPRYEFLVNTGMYVVRRESLQEIPDQGRYDMTDFIAALKAKGLRVGVFPIGENAWVDTGEWEGYRKAIDSLSKLGVRS